MKEGLPKSFDLLPLPNLVPDEAYKVKQAKLESELTVYLNICKKGLSLAKNVQSKKDYHMPDIESSMIESIGIDANASNVDDIDMYAAAIALDWQYRRPVSIPVTGGYGIGGAGGGSQAERVKQSLWMADIGKHGR